MYFHKSVVPVSSVDFCISANVVKKFRENLVLARGNRLEIYELLFDENINETSTHSDVEQRKFVLYDQFEFYSNICELGKIRSSSHEVDLLVVCFPYLKISILRYSSEKKFVIEEIFDLESELNNHEVPLAKILNIADQCVKMNSGPNYSSVSILFDFKFVILLSCSDILRVTTSEQETHSQSTCSEQTVDKFVFNLTNINPKFHRVIDTCIMTNYGGETIGILYEPLGTFTSRISSRSDTVRFSVIGFEKTSKLAVTLWTTSNLPFDSFKLIPLCSSLGGIAIMAVNHLFYLNQGIQPFVMTINNGGATTSLNHDCRMDLGSSFENAVVAVIGDNLALSSTSSGDLVLIEFKVFHQKVQDIKIFFVGCAIPASSMCIYNDNVFIASRSSTSSLVKLRFDAVLLDLQAFNKQYKDDLFDYKRLASIGYDAIASIKNLGFCTSSCFCVSGDKRAIDICHLFVNGNKGCIQISKKFISLTNVASLEIPNSQGIWLVKLMIDVGVAASSYLIISLATSTLILQNDSDIVEVEESNFITDSCTIAVYNNPDRSAIQICSNRLRYLSAKQIIQDISFEFSICSISYSFPFLAVVDQDAQLHLYSIDILKANASVSTVCLFDDIEVKYVSLNTCLSQFSPDRELNNNTVMACVCLSGTLQVYLLPSGNLVFLSSDFFNLPCLMTHNQKSYSSEKDVSELKIKEIELCYLGESVSCLYLFVRLNLMVVVYKAYCDGADLVFKRLKCFISMYNSEDNIKKLIWSVEKFEGFKAVFIGGMRPMIVRSSDTSMMDVYPLSSPPLVQLLPFSNQTVDSGYVTLDKNYNIEILCMEKFAQMKNGWVNQLTHTSYRPLMVQYYQKMNILIIGAKMHTDDSPDQTCGLVIYCPRTGQSTTQLQFDDEKLVCLKVVKLQIQENYEEYLVACTNRTEPLGDYSYTGKLYILRLLDKKSTTKFEPSHSLEVVHTQDFDGGVSNFDCVDGKLLISSLYSVFICEYKTQNNSFVISGSIGTGCYSTSLTMVRDLVAVGDIYYGVQLLHYQKAHGYLSFIAKKNYSQHIFACDFIVNDKKLDVITSNSSGSIITLSYCPEISNTKNGTELLVSSGLKTTSVACAMMKSVDVHSVLDRKLSVVWMINTDGSISVVLPLTEKMFRRYLLLQSRLNDFVPDSAGLNFERERGLFCDEIYLDTNTKVISDSTFLNEFLNLDLIKCQESVARLGYHIDQIFEDMAKFDRLIEYNLSCKFGV